MNTYNNLNSVTLYKTHMFTLTDTMLFTSKQARDLYFDNLGSTDKLVMEEFTDLYENRLIALPYNYLDLKKYNIMKLHFDDGLGHIEDYYCNVDNYYYVSTDVCVPIYRIDYFLTYGYLLANKNIDIITDRRTLTEDEVTKLIKADDISVPRVKYIPQNIAVSRDRVKKSHYVIYLNKTRDNVGVNSFKINFKLKDGDNEYLIDTHTIGCYVCVCDEIGLTNRLNYEPNEYIEKIIEVFGEWDERGATETHPEHYYYIYNDFDAYSVIVNNDTPNEASYNHLFKTNRKGDPFHRYKNIMSRLNCMGVVVQGNEFDPKDYDNSIKPLGLYYDNVCFTYLGNAVFYPLGYRGQEVNKDYCIMWQCGRNFSYSSDYLNSLAYKQTMELNEQATLYANKTAGINSYYLNQLLNNSNTQIDISKRQSDLSYESQINSMSLSMTNLKNDVALLTANKYNPFYNIKQIAGQLTGANSILKSQFDLSMSNLNIMYLGNQQKSLGIQKLNQAELFDKQKEANTLNTKMQVDLIGATRDNTIANIAISNKYNNAKPNAYYPTDYTKFSNYVYHIVLDEVSVNDKTQQHNIETYYNVNGIYVGYKERLNLSHPKGLIYDYYKGSLINNNNLLSEELTQDIYLQLANRLENGIRIWRNDNYFGNMSVDNTFWSGGEGYNLLEPKTDLLETEKTEILNHLYGYIYSNNYPNYSQVDNFIDTFSQNVDYRRYARWVNDNLYWGVSPVSSQDQGRVLMIYTIIKAQYGANLGKQFYIDKLKEMYDLTIYEKQYGINYINNEQ